MKIINKQAYTQISGGSVYELKDVIVWNQMPGDSYNYQADLEIIEKLTKLSDKPVKIVS